MIDGCHRKSLFMGDCSLMFFEKKLPTPSTVFLLELPFDSIIITSYKNVYMHCLFISKVVIKLAIQNKL